MKTTIHHRNKKSLELLAGSLLLMCASCADDNMLNVDVSSSKTIQFDVSAVSFTSQTGPASRYGESVCLEGDEATLYLSPIITPRTDSKGTPTISGRSSIVNGSTIDDFGVIAYTSTGGLYMNDVKVTRANGWAPEKEYLWPGKEKLTFSAYSPYGIVREDAEGNWIVDYTTPDDVKDQTDLLWATQTTADASPCHLSFNHALCAVRFVTGAKMTPCTVKNITISGIPSVGILDISTGTWSNVSAPASYSIAPANSILTPSDGGDYVTPGTPITAEDETFLMIPGVMPDDATITLTIDVNGKESTFTASIAGQQWPQGSIVSYRLSATPESNQLILDVLGTFETPYPGQTVPFQVKSCYLNESGDSIPVSWKAEFVDEDGQVIDMPEWVQYFPTTGNGLDYTKAVTKMQKLTFTKLSAESQKLQDTPDVNTTSGMKPYNLSNPTGGSAIMNTANCYVINAPGIYSLPLVYGNAIKDGADNKSAYTSTSHNRYALKTFVNNLGNPITSPFIYENQGCSNPADAVLMWEGRLDLIRNVTLNPNHTITFEVPAESIRQGNAIIALRDKNGTVMWSWNIWVTDYVPGTELASETVSGHTYSFYPRNVGRIMGGDITVFPHCQTHVRFTQVGEIPDGLEPLSTTILLNQTGITTETVDCYNFYQWGRKDPIKSSMNEWFDSDHYEIKKFRTEDLSSQVAGDNDFLSEFIKHPDVFFTGSHEYVFPYTNLWDSSLSATSQKTIYDPCPVGAKVPYGTGLLAVINLPAEYGEALTGTHSKGIYFTLSDGSKMFFPELGYRSGMLGAEVGGYGINGTIWLAQPAAGNTGRIEAGSIIMDASSVHQQHNPRLHGFGVRPVME